MATEKAAFKKSSTKEEVKPFQVRMDLMSGVYLGLGFALVNLTVSLIQIMVEYAFFYSLGN
jgi:F0F1-type ATP synthase assembly protein I